MSGFGHNSSKFTDDSGWIAISRAMRDHPIVGFHLFATPCDPSMGATQPAIAFIDLIMECEWKGRSVMNGGIKMDIQRGQLIGAVSWLASRWNWTPKAVRCFLDRLENDGMIERLRPWANKGQQKGKQANVISLCNYDKYQLQPDIQRQSEGPTKGQLGADKGPTRGHIYKEEQLNKGTIKQLEKELQRGRATGNDYWSKAMHVEGAYDPNEGVSLVNGRIQLLNGVKAHWLSRFEGDEIALEDALTQALAYVQPSSGRPLKVQVEAQLTRQISDRRDRDRRYQRRVEADPAATEAKETKADRIMRLARQATAKLEAEKGQRR